MIRKPGMLIGLMALTAVCAACRHTGVKSAAKAQPSETMVEPKSGLEFRALPGGTFRFGCEPEDEQCTDDEKPSRLVTVDPFWMGITEVTTDAYANCVAAGACTMPDDNTQECNWGRRGNHPVNCVSWTQANQFCAWIGGRLPTAEEWEFAAKGGEGRMFPWGNDPVFGTRANFADGTFSEALGDKQQLDWVVNNWVDIHQKDGFAATAPVGSFPAGRSKHGLLDMAGNVWEWTASDFKDSKKEIRGGGWLNNPSGLRASFRVGYDPSTRLIGIGLRCVM